VRSVWLRHDLETFRKRLKAPEAKAAQEHTLVLTEDPTPRLGAGAKKRNHTARSKLLILVTWARKTPIMWGPSRA
jgi:hypothetical protein